MGFQGLVKRVNNMGFFAPILSQKSISWGELIEKVKTHEMGRVGDPVTLFESVHTFRELANFGYDMNVLTAQEGQEFLNSLTAVTSEDQLKSLGPPVHFNDALKNAKKNAEMLKAKGTLSVDMAEIVRQSQQVVNVAGSSNLTQGDKQLIMKTAKVQEGAVEVDTIIINDDDIMVVPINAESQQNVVEISSTPSVSGDDVLGMTQGNGTTEAAKSAKDLEMEEINDFEEEGGNL